MEEFARSLFPYAPYQVQMDYIRYMSLIISSSGTNNKAGIIESPTGTGKTASLLCGSIAWLVLGKSIAASTTEAASTKKLPSWVLQHKQKTPESLLAANIPKPKHRRVESSVDQVISQILNQPSPSSAGSTRRRVYYCSRTHSQLSQVVVELKRIISHSTDERVKRLVCVPLASRKQLCIHPKVLKSSASSEGINDACKTRLEHNSCEFFHQVDAFAGSDRLSASQLDIEDLCREAKSASACPYYTARQLASIKADIIVLPQSSMLDAETREALGIDLGNSLVIFDEGHNLVSAINDMNSISVSISHDIEPAVLDLQAYLKQYQGRMMSANVSLINSLIDALQHLLTLQDRIPKEPTDLERALPQLHNHRLFETAQFLSICQLDNLNLFSILNYLSQSQLPLKAADFRLRSTDSLDSASESVFTINSAAGIRRSAAFDDTESGKKRSRGIENAARFLRLLATTEQTSRIIVHLNKENRTIDNLQLVSLIPTESMDLICERADHVLVTGGTMTPIDDVKSLLFRSPTPFYSCNHVISSDRVCALVIDRSCDEQSIPFRFTHGAINNQQTISNLLSTIRNVCMMTPGGVAVFVPSYSFLDALTMHHNGQWRCKENMGKEVFLEDSSHQSSVWMEYQRAASSHGALLFAVMNGKLSEGVNFSDQLARAVVVVGLPFPNITDPEVLLRSMVSTIKDQSSSCSFKRSIHAGDDQPSSQNVSNSEYLENCCMRVVNQTVGRAIRHVKDYAAIILIDQRYKQTRIQRKLSHWLLKSLLPSTESSSFGHYQRQLALFFRRFTSN